MTAFNLIYYIVKERLDMKQEQQALIIWATFLIKVRKKILRRTETTQYAVQEGFR